MMNKFNRAQGVLQALVKGQPGVQAVYTFKQRNCKNE